MRASVANRLQASGTWFLCRNQKKQTAPFSGAVAILLLAPAQLGYALARAENYLPLRQVAGVRMLAIASVVACVACAGLLTASVAVETTRAMDQVTPYVLWATRVIALLLVAAVMLPRRRLFPPRD